MDKQIELEKFTEVLQEMDGLLETVKTTFKEFIQKYELHQKILEIKIRGLGNGCPFDPIAKCSLAPGVSCAEIDCPVWMDMVRYESC